MGIARSLMLLFAVIVSSSGLIAAAYYHSPEPPPPEPEEGEVVEIVVRGTEFELIPNAIWVAEPGLTLRIIFVNEGRVSHAFAVEGVGSTSVIGPGENATLEFVVEEEGILVIFCPVANHRELGMEGVLVAGLPMGETVTLFTTTTLTSLVETTVTSTVVSTQTVTETREQTVTATQVTTVREEVTRTTVVAAAAIIALIVGLAAGFLIRR